MTFQRNSIVYEQRERRLRMETLLRNTTCSKGHTHPPWNTTGILRIEKCESICGFCQKETKTAANLRKHVAIHIKNERLNLSIAEGSSGRGRLEMPQAFERENSTSSRASYLSDDVDSSIAIAKRAPANRARPNQPSPNDPFSPSAVLMSMHQTQSQPSMPRSFSSNASSAVQFPTPGQPAQLSSYSYPYAPMGASSSSTPPVNSSYQIPFPAMYQQPDKDPFRTLRLHKIRTKAAWTVIPGPEGNRILDLCKSLSVAQPSSPPTQGRPSSVASQPRVPCYHRETLFDEEWQAHMRDVHGVFLLWPDTWMRRIEVVDLEHYGGDIGGINDLMME